MMKAESYYCPSCGNRPYAAFVHCKLIEQRICADCDDVIRQYFQNKVDDQSSPPEQVVNLVACGSLTLDECRDLWHRQEIVTLLRELRDEINFLDEAGEMWNADGLEHINCKIREFAQEDNDIND